MSTRGAFRMMIDANRWRWLLVAAVCVAMAGCKSDPKKTESRVKELEPKAAAAAQERGRLDLNCEQVTANVLSHDATGSENAYSLFRPEYKVAAQGCGKRTVFTVVCTDEGVCTAMAQTSVIETVK